MGGLNLSAINTVVAVTTGINPRENGTGAVEKQKMISMTAIHHKMVGYSFWVSARWPQLGSNKSFMMFNCCVCVFRLFQCSAVIAF